MSTEGEARRPPWAGLRDELLAAGFHPSRRLGQNFLLDENLLRAIVRDAQIDPGATVLEVGPGLGFLTRHLLAAGARVVAAEIDPRLAERARAALKKETLGSDPSLRLIVGDVLDSKHALAPGVLAELPARGPWHVVANLPYAVSGPVLAVCAALPNAPRSMTVLVQLELAERIVADPGTADWGPLSIRLQVAYSGRIVRRVAPDLFWPRPQVDSALVRLEALPDPPAPAARARLSTLVERLFQRRRQRLARVLGELAGSRESGLAWAASAGLSGGERAEDLPLETLARLAAWEGTGS